LQVQLARPELVRRPQLAREGLMPLLSKWVESSGLPPARPSLSCSAPSSSPPVARSPSTTETRWVTSKSEPAQWLQRERPPAGRTLRSP
jgi:hypothetical protein